LHDEPKLRLVAEETAQAQRALRRDCSAARDDFPNMPRDAQLERKCSGKGCGLRTGISGCDRGELAQRANGDPSTVIDNIMVLL